MGKTKVHVIFKVNFRGDSEFVGICSTKERAEREIKRIKKSYYLSAPEHYSEEYTIEE